MSLVEKIKSFFKKEKEEIKENRYKNNEDNDFQTDIQDEKNNLDKCNNCLFRLHCKIKSNVKLCEKYRLPENYDPNKKTILLIDDNFGIISFLEDDIKHIFKKYNLNEEEYNIITFSSQDAAIKTIFLTLNEKDFKVDYAIIDLTYGAIIKTDNGNVKFNGVDVLCYLYKKNPNIKFIFYTGNALNKSIKTINDMIDKFKKCYGKDLDEFVINKNQFSYDERFEIFYERFFK